MATQGEGFNDSELVYGFLAEYLDDDIPGHLRGRFDSALKSVDDRGDLLDRYSRGRGQMQVMFRECRAEQRLVHDLHVLVEDDATRATHEAHDIQEAGRAEFYGNFFRRSVMIAALVAAAVGTYFYLTPPKKAGFDPLQSLVHEAKVMEEDPEGRLDMPSPSIGELQNYINAYPELGFKPPELAAIDGGWEPEGASVIDYETAKIIVIQYGKLDAVEKLFLFMLEGNLAKLPKAEPGNHAGLLYQTYDSDTLNLNVIAWQISEGVLGMMVGHAGATDLATFAQSSLKT